MKMQMELLEMKNAMCEMKYTLDDGINSQLEAIEENSKFENNTIQTMLCET